MGVEAAPHYLLIRPRGKTLSGNVMDWGGAVVVAPHWI